MDKVTRDAVALVRHRDDIFLELFNERMAQDRKWGERNHPDGTGPQFREQADTARQIHQECAENFANNWRLILDEEVLEAFAETDPVKLRAELIQVAAVAVAWIEAIDRREVTDA